MTQKSPGEYTFITVLSMAFVAGEGYDYSSDKFLLSI
jgi:hypothetical protein